MFADVADDADKKRRCVIENNKGSHQKTIRFISVIS